jgi:hypothetical protein
VTELSPTVSGGNITFQVPLAAKIVNPSSGCQESPGGANCLAKHWNLKETNEIINGLKGATGCTGTVAAPHPNLLAEPVAESGHLCAYTGMEELSEPAATRQGIINPEGEAGAWRTGAMIAYANEITGTPGLVRAQGSWAVKG